MILNLLQNENRIIFKLVKLLELNC